jgi:hypothetical protein
MKKIIPILLALLPIAGFAQTKVAGGQRALYDLKSIGEIRITFPTKNWTDALDSLRIYGEDMLTCDLSIDGVKYSGAGIRYRGDKSYQLGQKRNPFSIKLNHSDVNTNHQGYQTLKISSALRDPSMVREVLFQEIAAKYLPTPSACYTKMFVNEEYIGLFINVESVSGKFLEDRFQTNQNALYKAGVDHKQPAPASCKQNINGSLEYEEDLNCYRQNFELKGGTSWNPIQELARVLNNDVKNIHKVLDVDRTLWMLALNNVMVNLSSYSGTATDYYLYKDNHGHFQPVLWDLNLSFGGYKNTGSGSDKDNKGLQRLDPLLHADNPYRPLISQLLKDPLHKKIYLSHIRQIVEENFKNGEYEKRANELQAMIVVPYLEDKNRGYSQADFQSSIKQTVGRKSKIPGIAELMSARAKFLLNHPELTSLPSKVSDVTQHSRAKFEKTPVDGFRFTAKADRFPKRMWLYYRLDAKQPFTEMAMDEEQAKNLATGERRFIANVEAKSADAEIEYYIMVENAGAVAFYPAAYPVKPNKVKLADLNK